MRLGWRRAQARQQAPHQSAFDVDRAVDILQPVRSNLDAKKGSYSFVIQNLDMGIELILHVFTHRSAPMSVSVHSLSIVNNGHKVVYKALMAHLQVDEIEAVEYYPETRDLGPNIAFVLRPINRPHYNFPLPRCIRVYASGFCSSQT